MLSARTICTGDEFGSWTRSATLTPNQWTSRMSRLIVMSLFPFSTMERNDGEIPLPSATSASETPRERRSCRSRAPRSLVLDSRPSTGSTPTATSGPGAIGGAGSMLVTGPRSRVGAAGPGPLPGGGDELLPAIVVHRVEPPRRQDNEALRLRHTELVTRDDPCRYPGTSPPGSFPTSKSTIRWSSFGTGRAKVAEPSKSDVPRTTPEPTSAAPQQPRAHSPSRAGSER